MIFFKYFTCVKRLNVVLNTLTCFLLISILGRLYAVQRGMEIDRKSPDSKAFLMKLMDVLDSAKASLKDNESISSETVGQAHLENYALKLFANADTRDRNSDFGP